MTGMNEKAASVQEAKLIAVIDQYRRRMYNHFYKSRKHFEIHANGVKEGLRLALSILLCDGDEYPINCYNGRSGLAADEAAMALASHKPAVPIDSEDNVMIP